MTHKIIETSEAPKAIGPYSQAVRAGDFLFLSGQIAISPQTGELVKGGIEAETKQALENIGAVLRADGADFSDVVKTVIYLADLGDFAVVNEIYAKYFPKNPPARATVQVVRLPKDARIEIDIVAHLNSR